MLFHKKNSLLSTISKFIAITFFIFIILSNHTYAFQIETRRMIAEDAIQLCPDELKAILLPHISIIKDCMARGDTLQTPINPKLFKQITSDLIGAITSGEDKKYNTINRFGLVAVFIAEAINPYYSSSSFLATNRAYQASEKDKIVIYDGYQLVTESESNILALINKYQDEFGKIRPSMIDSAYSDAVNETVDFWIFVWLSAGKHITKFSPIGFKIDHRIEKVKFAVGPNAKLNFPSPAEELKNDNPIPVNKPLDKNISNPDGLYWQLYNKALAAMEKDDWNEWEDQVKQIDKETNYELSDNFWNAYHGIVAAIKNNESNEIVIHIQGLDQEAGLELLIDFYEAYGESLTALSNEDWREWEHQMSRMEKSLQH